MDSERGREKYEQLIAKARARPPVPTAVAHPCDAVSIQSAVEAARLGLIVPILVGPRAKVEAAAAAAKLDISGLDLVDASHSHDAADRAVALVREGKAQALMKGSLHTDVMLHAVVQKESGLRTGRLLSHCALIF